MRGVLTREERPHASSHDASSPVLAALALVAAGGLAIAQPLYQILAAYPAFLVAHRVEGSDRVLLAVGVSLALPLVFWLLLTALGTVGGGVARWVYSAAIGLVLGLMPLYWLRVLPLGTAPRLVLFAVAAIVSTALYLRLAWLRRLLAWLGFGSLLFPVLFLVQVGVGGGASISLSGVEVGRPRPVILVIFDELSTLSMLKSRVEIDRARFPHFARLADTSTWYREATTVAHNTVAALPAILTGRYPPDEVRSPDRSGHPQNLFALLEGAMAVRGIERATNLCGATCDETADERSGRWRRTIADAGAVYLALVLPEVAPPISSDWSGFWGEPESPSPSSDGGEGVLPSRTVERLVAGLSESPDSGLHVLHLGVPHAPWRFLPDGTEYYSRDRAAHGLQRGTWMSREWETVQGLQRHLLQAGYADTLLGEILDGIEAADRWHDSLIIVTSDHGAAFVRRLPRRMIVPETLIEIAYVPLLVKMPGQRRGEVDPRNAMTIDVLPTLAEALEVELPWPVDGVSLLGTPRSTVVKRIFRSHKTVGAGEELTFETHGEPDWRKQIQRRKDRFPEPSLYHLAPGGKELALLGTRPVGGEPETEFHAFLRDLDRGPGGSTVIPLHLEGELRPASMMRGPTRVAIALDGVIRAITETYTNDNGKRWRFTALLDPAHLPSGRNPRVDLYWLGRTGSRAPLRAIPLPQLQQPPIGGS